MFRPPVPFVLLFSLATACGDVPQEYVCRDAAQTRVTDPARCPVDAPVVIKETVTVKETVTKYKCVATDTYVDRPEDCPRACADGYAYEEVSKACLKVCPPGQTVNASGDGCVRQQVRGTVSVRPPNGGVPRLVDTTVGTRTDLFPLIIQDETRAVTLRDVRFLAYVGVEQDGVVPDRTLWLHTQADVAEYLGDCTLTDASTAQVAGPVSLDHVPLSEQAMVFFPEAVGSGTSINVSVQCDLKPSPVAYHVALVLDLVTLVDAETGEPIVGSEVTFEDLNSDFSYQVRAAPLPPCPPPVLQVGQTDWDPTTPTTLREVLRFDVVADASCRDLQTWSVQFAIIDNGWYTAPSTVRVTDIRDPSRSLFTNIQTNASNGEFLFLMQDTARDAVPIQASRPLTLRFQMDTEQARAPGTDTVRVDVTGFCYRDPFADVETCLDNSSVLITGETWTF